MDVKILVVEDEAIVALEIQNTLERNGYQVVGLANSGEEAIRRATEALPDLILMDIRIKGTMDGIEAANHIRATLHIPVIFLTAHAEDDSLQRAKQTQPYGYILKPFQERDLKVAVEIALYAAKVEQERERATRALRQMQRELEQKVTERTAELEKAKEEAESANQSKSDFLASISHELRSPLHHILSFARFGIKMTGEVPEKKIIKFFSSIEESGKVLLNLVNDLLDLSKLESGKMEYHMTETSLSRIVRSIISESHSSLLEKGIDVTFVDAFEDNTTVVCDFNKIGQVIRNLMTNAEKFSSRGGTISVFMQDDTLPLRINNGTEEELPALRLTIRDEGTGIPEGELELIFDKFTQSSRTCKNHTGTGLGLAICREIVESHKGKIWASNNADGGADICVVLPRQQAAIRRADDPAEKLRRADLRATAVS